jgi:pseudouridine-5'-phosphate glycosidase
LSTFPSFFRVSEEVRSALADGRGVVGLETTLVSHGFPGEAGLGVALESERQVRASGSVPATVGVIDGEVVVGLDETELSRFAGVGRSREGVRKVGPRDIASCVATGALGATTVGGTLAVCRAAGIRFMATGGTGGVHRDFSATLDISADLYELARAPVLVVASGAKSLLDVRATAEMLESLGIPVLGWRTATLPRFYTSKGGPPVSARVDTAGEVAKVARYHWSMPAAGGLLLAKPPPRDLDVDALLEEALRAAEAGGAKGQEVTPAVLAYLHEASGGETALLNQELIAANARLAGEVAAAYWASAGNSCGGLGRSSCGPQGLKEL